MVDIGLVGYVVPKGCFVVPFLSAVHLDENLYEGARTFNPWRWMDPLNKVSTNFLISFLIASSSYTSSALKQLL